MNKKPDKPSQLRAAAEAQLAHAPEAKLTPHPAEELLHELQVYQIELEMQNEQLRQAQVELEESRDRYVDLYEFAPVGYMTLTREGVIAEVNLTGATLLGSERNKIINRRFSGFVSPDDSALWNSHFLNVVLHDWRQSCELTLRHNDGSQVYVRLDCLHIGTDNASSVRIALTDITERRKINRSLRESEERWAFAIEGSGDGVWDWDLQTGKFVFSKRYKEILGFSGNTSWNSLGDWKDRVNPKDMGHAMVALESYLDGKLPAYAVEYRMLCGDGGWKWMLARGMVVARTQDGMPMRMIGTHTDITERKQMERRLHELAAHLQTVREEEKANIAREIHDDLGGTLTALKMEAYCLAEGLSAHKETMPLIRHIESMAQLTDNATNVVRRIISGLRPSILDDLGLPAALEWQAAQFNKRTGIECRINCVVAEGCEQKLDKVHSINLFRIFQETLTNVARHSGASRVAAEFHYNDEEILLSVSDNGRGIQEECAGGPMHYGMLGMAERAEQLGGTIKFCGVPGSGLSVTVNLPLANNRKKEEA